LRVNFVKDGQKFTDYFFASHREQKALHNFAGMTSDGAFTWFRSSAFRRKA
jgi:hypothetical protein